MKRILLIIVLLTGSMVALAKSPKIPLCQAFDGRYNNSKGVKIYEVKQTGNYYYSITVKDDPEIISQLQKWVKETENLANSISTSISDGNYNIILFLPDSQLNVGISYPGDNSKINIFLQSSYPFM